MQFQSAYAGCTNSSWPASASRRWTSSFGAAPCLSTQGCRSSCSAGGFPFAISVGNLAIRPGAPNDVSTVVGVHKTHPAAHAEQRRGLCNKRQWCSRSSGRHGVWFDTPFAHCECRAGWFPQFLHCIRRCPLSLKCAHAATRRRFKPLRPSLPHSDSGLHNSCTCISAWGWLHVFEDFLRPAE